MTIELTSRKHWGKKPGTETVIPGRKKFTPAPFLSPFGLSIIEAKDPDTLMLSSCLSIKGKPILEMTLHKEDINEFQQIVSVVAKGAIFNPTGYQAIYEWKPTLPIPEQTKK